MRNSRSPADYLDHSVAIRPGIVDVEACEIQQSNVMIIIEEEKAIYNCKYINKFICNKTKTEVQQVYF